MLRKSKLIIPFAPIETIIKENTTQRIGKDAVEKLTDELIFHGKIISRKAWEFSKNAGRKTITGEDIKLANDILFKLK